MAAGRERDGGGEEEGYGSGWEEGVAGLAGWVVGGGVPRGGFCKKKYRTIDFSLLHVEIKFRMRVYL